MNKQIARFPKPWRSIHCGDCYRIFDANGRELFVITGDEFAGGDEENNPDVSTVFGPYGSGDPVLCEEIEKLFPEASDDKVFEAKIVATRKQDQIEASQGESP